MLLLAVAASHAGDKRPTFPDDATAAADDEDGADRGRRPLALRLRVSGPSADYRGGKLYQRLEWRPALKWRLYLLTEKDPGESRWNDFSALYAERLGPSGFDLIAGDLRPGFGQGLLFSRSQVRHATTLPSIRRDSARLGHRSSAENASLRGAALRWTRGDLQTVVLAGVARRDARFDEDGRVTSLPEGGLHVTSLERAGEDGLRSLVLGARLRQMRQSSSFGLTAQALRYDHLVDLRRVDRVSHTFTGQAQHMVAADVTLTHRGGASFGEVAVDGAGTWACIAGVRTKLGRARVAGSWRSFSPGFHSPFGGQPSGRGTNESGILVVAEGRSSLGRWRGYSNQLRRSQPTYSNPLSTTREEWGADITRAAGSAVRITFAGQRRRVTRWSRDVGPFLERSSRGRMQMQLAIKSSGRSWLRGNARVRLETRRVRSTDGDDGPCPTPGECPPGRDDRGLLLSASWRSSASTVRHTLHVSRFVTDAYAARIYEFEHDVPGTVSVRPLSGNGWRAYGLVRWRRKQTELTLRYRLQIDRRTGRINQLASMQLDISSHAVDTL